MIYTLNDLREIVSPVAEKYRLRAVYVFGSYARGEAREDSDVDLLVDCAGSRVVGIEFGGLYNDLEEALGKPIDLVTVRSLEQPTHYACDLKFRENLKRERKEIYAAV